MSLRFVLPACLAVLFSLCAGCRRKEIGAAPPKSAAAKTEAAAAPAPAPPLVLPPVPAGQARFQLELLRAPAPSVADALLEVTDSAAQDAALRDRLLAAGATRVVECAVTGPFGEKLKDDQRKFTKEYPLFAWASLWQQHAYDLKEGKPLSKIEDEEEPSPHAQGVLLEASLDETRGGALVDIRFEWAGAPVIRPVTSWPVPNHAPHIVQDRIWSMETKRSLTVGGPCLLAVAPEPPLADGNDTGFVFLAFGKIAAPVPQEPPFRDPQPGTLLCWTLEMPAADTLRRLFARAELNNDGSLLRTLLREGADAGHGARTRAGAHRADSAASLLNVMMLRTDRAGVVVEGGASVQSRLSWDEPIGFEPPDTRVLPFVPVPNDAHPRSMAHMLTSQGPAAEFRLPVGGVTWTRWHGATRGAPDEPAGVESSATGSSGCDFFRRTPGRIFLANVHTCGEKVRFTFARAFYPAKDEKPTSEQVTQVLETPPAPWLPRLVAGVDLESLVPELTAALTNGSAALLHTEICTMGTLARWNREDTWPWMALARDYINPNIANGRLRYNPRAVSGSTPACTMEVENGGGFAGTLSGAPAGRRFGFWLTDAPGYSAETSSFSLTEWPQFGMNSTTLLPVDRTLVLHVSLGRSWKHPEQPALHWVVFRRAEFPGAENSPPEGAPDPPPGVPPSASFTITDRQGTVLAHATLPATASGASLSDGRMLQSLEPRASGVVRPFHELEPSAAADHLEQMNGKLEISFTLDGLEISISEGRWTLKHSLAPARMITEKFVTFAEPAQPADAKGEKVPVSCERLVLRKEKLTGTLPAPGGEEKLGLDGARILTVKVR